MGLLDKAKEAVGSVTGGKSEADEIGEDWAEEMESQVQEEDELMEPDEDFEEEQAQQEWESAYRFAEDFLEQRGFSSMMDFTNKCMAYQINKSPMYRDRINNGVETMNRISSMHQQLEQIGGDKSGDKSMKQKAEELQAANEVIDEAQKLAGEEEAMVRDAMALGEDLVNALAQNAGANRQPGNVNSNVQSRNEEM